LIRYDLAVVDNEGSTDVVVDASPLIYLAKLDALDVFAVTGRVGLVPPTVYTEVAAPALTYVHPDAVTLERATRAGTLTVVDLSERERRGADELRQLVPGIHSGEREVLAVARERKAEAVLFERRGKLVARALGLRLVDLVELLVHGTPDRDLLEGRIDRFASLVNMRRADHEALKARIKGRRLR
jgi:predicted nucleic acid-binding protein